MPACVRRWVRPFIASPLSRSFALMVIATSTMITLVMTAIQLWSDYQTSLEGSNDVLSQVEASYSSSLSASLWTYDHALVQSQLDGIANLPQIEWVEISTDGDKRWTAGEQSSTYALERQVPLFYSSGGKQTLVGQLTLLSSIDAIYWQLARKFAVILGLNLIKTLCMSVVIIFLFHRMVGRHLIDLAAYLRDLKLTEASHGFQLRRRGQRSGSDELDQLAYAINMMQANIQTSYDAVTQYRDGLVAALDKERELSSLQRKFVAMVSHEFRTPLAIIDGNAQRLLRRKAAVTEDKLQDVLAKIRTSVVRLTDLMESILSSSRLEDGKIKCEPGDCDLAALLRELCGSFRELKTGHSIIDRIGDLPQVITADENLLRQVFSNLLSNAVKYAPADTSVWVTAGRGDDDHVVISVRDEGVGIPEHEREKLFQRFFRASTSTGIPGTGIGLHLVKHLIEMHGGRIDVESGAGEGATFTVRLPIEQPAAGPDADQAVSDDHTQAGLVLDVGLAG